MSQFPGNPCHKDANFPAPSIKIEKCQFEGNKDCKYKKPSYIGGCSNCDIYRNWAERFLQGESMPEDKRTKITD